MECVSRKDTLQISTPVKKQSSFDIIDIRREDGDIDLKEEISTLINPEEGPRTLPTLLLYDKKGLQLFEEITYLDGYYLTNNEIEVLQKSSADIADTIRDGSMVIELGSGNLRKVVILLQALENAGKNVDYYALDLNEQELERTLALAPKFKHVACHGLLGTYDHGQEWLKQAAVSTRPKCVLHLGSSIGNFDQAAATGFLASFATVLGPDDSMIVGVDSCSDAEQVYDAYNEKIGLTHRFTLNGLQHANELYGDEVFNMNDWKAMGEYVFDQEGARNRAFVQPLKPTSVLGSVIQPHEKIQIEESWKFSKRQIKRMWQDAGLGEVASWDNGKEYRLHMLQKQNLPFPGIPSLYATNGLPTLRDWDALWEVWDIVTTKMLPDEELVEKPIKLRNACIFYLGHIPAFLDIQLTRTTKDSPTEPAWFQPMFERGIDPDVDDPSKCHDHSEIPDEWPPLDDILSYQERVRGRLRALYKQGQENIPRPIGRAIWLGFEHEVMHLETLLYMMLQSDMTLPPPHRAKPDFEAMAKRAKKARVANEWFTVPEQTITLGMEDPESATEGNGYFGWDIEKPTRSTKVPKFMAQGRPITNEEYARYLFHEKLSTIPASWCEKEVETAAPVSTGTNGYGNGTNGQGNSLAVPAAFLEGKFVRTFYGPVPLQHALDWPVFATYEELAGCATWMGGRIPTLEEAKSLYAYADSQSTVTTLNKLDRKVPAVNGHLINDGVEETPPPRPSLHEVDSNGEDGQSSNALPDSSLFVDLTAENIGFKNWHPTPVTHLGHRLGGQGSMGGVWEWTATPLRKHEGFEPMALYPGYSADFFDEKHNVVLGGSWASHPRMAGRKSFVNWYQRNYPYAWVGARLVKDVE